MNNLPNGGKVVIVDDSFQEILPLINILNKNCVPISYYTGRNSELPIIPLKGVRLFFLDLRFSPNVDAKTIVSNACNILKSILGENNGPYILVVWSSTGNEYKYELEQALDNKKYRPEYILCLSKADYFKTEDNEVYTQIDEIDKMITNLDIENSEDIIEKITQILIKDTDECKKVFIPSSIDKLQKELYDGLSSAGLLSLFILWENTVRNSAHEVVNEIYSQIPVSIPIEKKLPAMAYYLGKNRLEKQFDKVEDKDKLYAALIELNELFGYFYSEGVINIPVEEFLPINIQRNVDWIPSQAKFNSWKLLTSKGKNSDPGSIYEDKNKTFEFYKMIKKYPDNNEYKRCTKILKSDDRIQYIEANINGECETAQEKYPVVRVLPGILIPCEVYEQYEKSGVLCDIKGNKADYIFKDFGQFEYNFKDYYILFNINQSTFVEKSTLDSIKVCFKLQRKYYLKLRQAISENFSKQGVDLYK